MKLFLSSSLFTLAFLSTTSATSTDKCASSADLVNSAPTDFQGEPITVVSQDTDSVTYKLSQTWSDDKLCMIATHYDDTDSPDMVCPEVHNVAPGEVADYTAKCVNGIASINVYVFDPLFADNTSPVTVSSDCTQMAKADTDKIYLYQYEVPCGGDTCPAPTEPVCEDVKSTSFDFSNAGDIEAWLFGKDGGNKLQLDQDNVEISKTFVAPSGTTSMVYEFKFIASGLPDDQELYARVGGYYLNYGSALSMPTGSSTEEYFGEIKSTVSKIGSGFSPPLTITIEVPSTLYSNGYIDLGVRTTGSSDFTAYVDDVSVTLTCEDEFEEGTKAGGGGGDPHFQRWDREHSSFHGECDLVMVHSDTFHNHAGIDLHVRTTIQDYFSYIESAALRVGESVIEFHQHYFYLDGVKYTAEDLPMTFGGDFKYTISEAEIEAGKNARFYQYFKVDLHQDSSILFKFYKKFLTIAVSGHANDFADSVGLLGDYATGDMLSRSGMVMSDFDQYGFEWQVNPEDAKLFQDARAPQLPFEQCRLPTAARPARRKLRGADAALYEAAKEACAHVSGSDYDLCADDVMSTGDVGLASLW